MNSYISEIDTLKIISDRMSDNDPFFFVRFGDGELHVIEGNLLFRAKRPQKYPPTCQWFNAKFREELIESSKINDSNFFICCLHNSHMPKQVVQIERVFTDRTIGAVMAITHLFKNDREMFARFIDKCFNNKKTLLISKDSIINNELVKKMFRVKKTVEVDSWNAYYSLTPKFYKKILKLIRKYDIDTVVCCCGPVSNILAKDLFLNKINIKFLDLGSLLDGIAGNQNVRRWIQYLPDGHINYFNKKYLNNK